MRHKIVDESIKSPSASDNSQNPGISYTGSAKILLKLDGSCLKRENVTFNHKTKLNFYFVYEINLWLYNAGKDFALRNPLFGAVKITKKDNFDKYKCSDYGTRFDACRRFFVV